MPTEKQAMKFLPGAGLVLVALLVAVLIGEVFSAWWANATLCFLAGCASALTAAYMAQSKSIEVSSGSVDKVQNLSREIRSALATLQGYAAELTRGADETAHRAGLAVTDMSERDRQH